MTHSLLKTVQGRQRLLTAALHIARGTSLEPQAAERALLAQFVSGALTIDQVLAQLDAPATGPLPPTG